MIVNDLFSCPLSQTAGSNFYSSYFFVTVSGDRHVSMSAAEEVDVPLIRRVILNVRDSLVMDRSYLKKKKYIYKKRRDSIKLSSY